jgi:uncharacterized membrane protein
MLQNVDDRILAWIELSALAIEVLAVAVIVVTIVYSFVEILLRVAFRRDADWYRRLKTSLGRSLLLGLEILLAADVVRTVALDATLQSIAVLGLLVLIRTFLSWALIVELDGRWPWKARQQLHGADKTQAMDIGGQDRV